MNLAPGTELRPVGRQVWPPSQAHLELLRGPVFPTWAPWKTQNRLWPLASEGARLLWNSLGGRMAAHSSVAYPPPLPAPAVLPHNALGLRGLRSVECGGASSPSCLPFLTSYPAPLPIPRPCILVGTVQSKALGPLGRPSPGLGHFCAVRIRSRGILTRSFSLGGECLLLPLA